MNEATHGAFAARESLLSRFWHTLGYGMGVGTIDMVDWRTEEPTDGFAPGALVTDTIITVDFMDRLRLLVSGKARLEVSTKTDVLVNRSQSRSAFGVMRPGYK